MNGINPQTMSVAYAEIEAALGEVPGLRPGKWGNVPQPPGAYLSLPDQIERVTPRSVVLRDVQITVVVGRADAKASLDLIMRLTGEVADVLEPRRWSAFDDLAITRIEFDTVTIAGAPDVFLAAIFHTEIAGAST